MNDFDKAEMRHDLDKAVLYYEECPKYCECDICAEIEMEEEERKAEVTESQIDEIVNSWSTSNNAFLRDHIKERIFKESE